MNSKIKIAVIETIDEGKNSEHIEIEHLWATKTENGDYIVENIPMVAQRLSLGDTLKAEYNNEDSTFYAVGYVAVSGNTT
ncbi:DUF4265 domain-containing protein [Chitinophaga sp. B61]|uniref:DUF4265 domain-containing protein n=1 Tax=Chitinophaga rhizophila TaxID=2866212 RepID=A0ABS7GHU5_9BACT|nr:DUF4265 domain-containing protein [Chitinophaga rhizophila]MBW8687262.1 DUF4265 domain-containing protein [Chitinophaga rhizophila]